jgi:hypothetical protein
VGLERSTVLFRDPSNASRRFIPLLLAECKLPDALRRYDYIDFRKSTVTAFSKLLAASRPGAQAELANAKPKAARTSSKTTMRLAKRRPLSGKRSEKAETLALQLEGRAVGTVAYLDGALRSVEPHALGEVYEATQRAIRDLEMRSWGRNSRSKVRAQINARDGTRKVTVVLISHYGGITNISIRIGGRGDKERSCSVFVKIHEYLQE